MLWQLQIRVPNQLSIALLCVQRTAKHGEKKFKEGPTKCWQNESKLTSENMYELVCHRGRQVCWTVENNRKQGTFKNRTEMMHTEVGVNKSHRAHHKCLVSHVTSISCNPEQHEAIRIFWGGMAGRNLCWWGRETLKLNHTGRVASLPSYPTPKYSTQFQKILKISFLSGFSFNIFL